MRIKKKNQILALLNTTAKIYTQQSENKNNTKMHYARIVD